LKENVKEVCRYAVDVLGKDDVKDKELEDPDEWNLLQEIQPTLGKLRHVYPFSFPLEVWIFLGCILKLF
jgi:hypothetical protein